MSRKPSDRQVIGYLAFMGILLAFGIDVALPAFDEIRPALGLEPDSTRVTLIVTLYFLGMAVGQIFYGPVADRYGRGPALRVGIGIYALGAAGATFAPNIELLFASRLLWGLGAAAPGVLRSTIARDLYEGDKMAQIMSTMMAFFLIGPIFVPLLGEGILSIASWRWVFATGLLLAAVMFGWTFRFPETLDPADRQPLDASATITAIGAVLRTRVTMTYLAALTASAGAFVIYLGSSQPIFDRIYGRADQFAVTFGAAGILMAIGFFAVNSFIRRYGTHRVAIASVALSVALSLVLLVFVVAADGKPNFWIWIALLSGSNVFLTLITPMCYSLALQPLGELAGTASGVLGLVSFAGGSLLAALVDAQIGDTVTPMVLAYIGYGAVSLGFLTWAGRLETSSSAAPIPADAGRG